MHIHLLGGPHCGILLDLPEFSLGSVVFEGVSYFVADEYDCGFLCVHDTVDYDALIEPAEIGDDDVE